MLYRRILLATDGSDHSLKAAAQAAEMGLACGAAVDILSVAVEYSIIRGRSPFMAEIEVSAKEAVKAARDVVAAHGVVDGQDLVRVAAGNPGNSICEVARETGADLVVVGSRGEGRAGSILVGSTSQHVAHCSNVPVLLVR